MQQLTMIVLATRNKGKIAEIADLLKDFPVVLKNPDNFGPLPDVEEDGCTFDENAYKKASFYARILGFPALADDSGLTVAALNGAPGVLSARYAGENASDKERCAKLLRAMEGLSDRQAAFECVLSFAFPTGPALTYEARCEGLITKRPMWANGFGYDPIFYYPPLKKTFAQLTREEKSRVSHRGLALNEFKNEFDKVLAWLERLKPA